MGQQPHVSVIIPTYNRADYLPQTLDSLAAQTCRDFETIVVDDGSTDGTRELIQSRPEPITYIYQQNAGPAAARNRGLSEARGDYIGFLDSDDMWKPRFIEVMSACLDADPTLGMAVCKFLTIDNDGRILREGKKGCGGDVTAQLFASTFVTTPSVLVRRQVLCEVGGFNPALPTNEDYDLWLRISLKHRIGYVEEALCLRRSHPNTQSRSGSPVPLIRKARLLERYYEKPEYAAKIPADLARRRLAKVYYTAGKASHRSGCYAEACELLKRSLHYRPLAPKVWFWSLLAGVQRTISRNDPCGLLEAATHDATREHV